MLRNFLFGSALFALCTASTPAAWQGTATASYDVKATVDSFVGQAVSEPIAWTDNATEYPVTFQILKMETGKKKRDVEMQHMFHAEQHPEIVGVAKAEDLRKLEQDGDLLVTLTIAGVTQQLPARISNLVREEGKLSFDAYLEISLKAFGLKAPSIMKMINVKDLVKVTTRVELTKSP